MTQDSHIIQNSYQEHVMSDRSLSDIFHDDIEALAKALDIGTHARPISPHRMIYQEIIPAIRSLRERATKGSFPSQNIDITLPHDHDVAGLLYGLISDGFTVTAKPVRDGVHIDALK